jgi:hypothetical protein
MIASGLPAHTLIPVNLQNGYQQRVDGDGKFTELSEKR